jgi:hypothetical protein
MKTLMEYMTTSTSTWAPVSAKMRAAQPAMSTMPS